MLRFVCRACKSNKTCYVNVRDDEDGEEVYLEYIYSMKCIAYPDTFKPEWELEEK